MGEHGADITDERDCYKHAAETLGQAIADAAQAAGIYNGEGPLKGPHLLLLADLAGLIKIRETERDDARALAVGLERDVATLNAEGVKAGLRIRAVTRERDEARADVQRLTSGPFRFGLRSRLGENCGVGAEQCARKKGALSAALDPPARALDGLGVFGIRDRDIRAQLRSVAHSAIL